MENKNSFDKLPFIDSSDFIHNGKFINLSGFRHFLEFNELSCGVTMSKFMQEQLNKRF